MRRLDREWDHRRAEILADLVVALESGGLDKYGVRIRAAERVSQVRWVATFSNAD